MSIEQMRVYILGVYPGEKWAKKVTKMNDKQIYAIYMSFLNKGKIK